MATNTYIPIASITLGSSASSVTFSSIPQNYRDLVLVFDGKLDSDFALRFNGDTGSNYSTVNMRGYSSTAGSSSETAVYIRGWSTIFGQGNAISQIMDYSSTDKHKTVLLRTNDVANMVSAIAGRWANTNAITSIIVLSDTGLIDSGSTLSLYGIEA